MASRMRLGTQHILCMDFSAQGMLLAAVCQGQGVWFVDTRDSEQPDALGCYPCTGGQRQGAAHAEGKCMLRECCQAAQALAFLLTSMVARMRADAVSLAWLPSSEGAEQHLAVACASGTLLRLTAPAAAAADAASLRLTGSAVQLKTACTEGPFVHVATDPVASNSWLLYGLAADSVLHKLALPQDPAAWEGKLLQSTAKVRGETCGPP